MSLDTFEYLFVLSAIQKQIQQENSATQLKHTGSMIPHPVTTQRVYLEVAAAAPDLRLLLVPIPQEVANVTVEDASTVV